MTDEDFSIEDITLPDDNSTDDNKGKSALSNKSNNDDDANKKTTSKPNATEPDIEDLDNPLTDDDVDDVDDEDEDEDVDETDEDEVEVFVEKLKPEKHHKVLSKLLNKLGYIEGEINSEEDVLNMFDDYYTSSLNDDEKEIIRAVKAGIPLIDAVSMKLKSFDYARHSDEDIKKDVNVAKAVYRQYLLDSNVEEDEIDDRIEYAIDNETIYDKAVKAKTNGLAKQRKLEQSKLEEAANNRELAKQNRNKYLNDVRKDINSTDELFGSKLSKVDKEALFQLMTSPVEVRQANNSKQLVTALNKAISEDPIVLKQINYLLHKKVLGKSGKLDALSVKIISNAAKQLDDVTSTKKKKSKQTKSKDESDIETGIEALGNMFSGLKI